MGCYEYGKEFVGSKKCLAKQFLAPETGLCRRFLVQERCIPTCPYFVNFGQLIGY